MPKISFASILLFLNTLPTSRAIDNTIIRAKPTTQILHLSNLTHTTPNYYIVADKTTSAILITVKEVFIGNGHGAFNYNCEQNYKGGFQITYLMISDTANPTDDYLVVCDNEVKNKWKQKKYCSSNITIQYHQKQKNYLGYHSTIEYREIPNACHVNSCNKSDDCEQIDIHSTHYGMKYKCRCILDCKEKICKNHDKLDYSHPATDNKSVVPVQSLDKPTRRIWNITAERDNVIILDITLDHNKKSSNLSQYVIQIFESDHKHAVYVVDNTALIKGVKWISHSTKVTIVCDHPAGESILLLGFMKEKLKSFHYIHASPDVYTLGVGQISHNINTTTVWYITSDKDHFLNIGMSLKTPVTAAVENSIIQVFSSLDELTGTTVHVKELVGGSITKQIPGKSVRIECYPSIICKTYINIQVQKQPLRYYQYLVATDEIKHLEVNDTLTEIDTTNIWEISTDQKHYLTFFISLKKPFLNRVKRRSQNAYVKFHSPMKRTDAIVTIGDLSTGAIKRSFPCSNVSVECFPSKLCKEYINIQFKELLSSANISAGKKSETFQFKPDHTIAENIVSITTDKNAIEVNLTLANTDGLNNSGYLEIDDHHGKIFKFTKEDIVNGKYLLFFESNITIICHYAPFCQNLVIERRGIFLEEYCTEQTLDAPFSHHAFRWPDTPVASTAFVNCPAGFNGKVSRDCNKNVEWERPDYRQCVSREILRICNETESISQNNIVDPEHFNNLTSRLKNATAFGRCLYPGDLTTVARTVRNLADIVKNTSSEHSALSSIAKGYGEAVNNIVDLGLANVWTYTSKTFVKSNMLVILESVERLSENVAKKKVDSMQRLKREITKYTQKDTIHMEARNLEFDITFHERLAICEDSTVLSFDNDKSSQVTLSSSVFKAAVIYSPDRFIQVYTARFSTIPALIDDSTMAITGSTGSQPFINTDIVSSKVLNVPETVFQHLEKPAIIMFELRNISEISDLKEKCVFLNMTSGENNTWSSMGCSVDTEMSNETHVACKCTHLTNFAVLMDVFDVQDTIDYTDYTILTYISYIGGVMSVCACVITVIVFQYFSLRKERVLVHQQLALSIVFSQVFFLVGIDRTENHYVCTVMAVLMHYSLMAMFCWMLIEGVHLYIMLVKVFRRGRTIRKYVVFGWGFPLLVVGISVGVLHDDYGGVDKCWLSHNVLLWIFVPVVSLVIVTNTIILVIVLRIMMKSMLSRANSEERSAIKAGLKAAAILLPLLGITWTLGFLSVNNQEALVFTYLFTICNSLQGVFFFVFHCLLNTDVKNAFERRSQRRSMIKILTESLQQDSRSRKTSTLNTSKTSINTILTEDTYLAKKKWNKITNNDFDRIHREKVTTMADRNYHISLQKSFSDGIQKKWQNITKDFTFYNGKDNINILHGKGNTEEELTDGYITDVVLKDDAKDKDFRIEDLYSKPLRKRSVSEENKENNRVRFDSKNDEPKETRDSEELKDALVQELKQRLE